MRRWVALAITATILGAAGCGPSGAVAHPTPRSILRHESLVVNGVTRTYRLYVPATAPATASALVVALHGATNDGDRMATVTGLDDEAQASGFIAVYPDGLGHTWQVGFCCGGEPRSATVDEVFLVTLLDHIQQTFHADPRRTYLLGFSAGAIMAYRMACDHADRVTAVVSVAGVALMDLCHPSAPVSLMEVHGTADTLVPFNGGTLPGFAGEPVQLPSTEALVSAWARLDRCPGDPARSVQGLVTVESWNTCAAGTAVVLYALAGAGHTWFGPGLGPEAGAVDATRLATDFFRTLRSAT